MPYQRSKIPNLKRVLTQAAEAAVETAQSGLVSYAQQQRDLFVRKIEEQKFASFRVIFYPESGTNLSPRWLARKAYKGADERTAIATGHYVSQIKVFTKKPRRKPFEVRVGFDPRVRARDLDGEVKPATLNLVARVLEHGSERMQIPARPHWGPHFNVMRREAPRVSIRLSKLVADAIDRVLPGFTEKRRT